MMLLNVFIGATLVQTVWGLLEGNHFPTTTSSPDGTVLHQTLGLLVVELDKRVNDLQNKVATLQTERHQYVEKTRQLETDLSTERLKVESLRQILEGQNASLVSLLSENSFLKNATLQMNSTLSSLISNHEDLQASFLSENSLLKNATLQMNSTLSSLISNHEDLQANVEHIENVSMSLVGKDNNIEIQIRRILSQDVFVYGNLSQVQNVLHDLHGEGSKHFTMENPEYTQFMYGDLNHFKEKPSTFLTDYVYRRKPGFTAYLDGSFNGNGAVILPHVYSNIGSLYDPITGIFTADQAGDYAFYVGLECTGTGLKIIDLVKDGSKISHVTCFPKDEDIYYGSTFSVHHLDKGSKVWMRDSIHKTVTLGGKTTLSGFLL